MDDAATDEVAIEDVAVVGEVDMADWAAAAGRARLGGLGGSAGGGPSSSWPSSTAAAAAVAESSAALPPLLTLPSETKLRTN